MHWLATFFMLCHSELTSNATSLRQPWMAVGLTKHEEAVAKCVSGDACCVCMCAGAMLHKRTAVPAHMPATAADMLLPQVAPILHQGQGTCLHVSLACICNLQEDCMSWFYFLS